jgi:hypothetical protein
MPYCACLSGVFYDMIDLEHQSLYAYFSGGLQQYGIKYISA